MNCEHQNYGECTCAEKLNFVAKMMRKYDFAIDIESELLPTEWQDSGPWRSFELTTSGADLDECISKGYIAVIDQDGGEIDSYSLEDGPNDVLKDSIAVIERELLKMKKGIKI